MDYNNFNHIVSPPTLQLNNFSGGVGPMRSHKNIVSGAGGIGYVAGSRRDSYLYIASYIPYGLIPTQATNSQISATLNHSLRRSPDLSSSGQSSEASTPEMCSQKYSDLFSDFNCSQEEFERIKNSLSSMAIKIQSDDLWQDDIDDDKLISLASMYCRGKWKIIGRSLMRNKRYRA